MGQERNARGLRALRLATACAWAAALAVTAAASAQPTGNPPSQVFTGVLSDSKPAYRDVRLSAGDALKLWQIPDGSSPTDNVGFGIALSFGQLRRWNPWWARSDFGKECSSSSGTTSAGAGFYVAYYNTLQRNPSAFQSLGQVIVFQGRSGGTDARACQFATDPGGVPSFWVYDGCHGCGSEYQSHTWAAFVAPSTAVYRVLLGGYGGGYKLGMAVERLNPESAPAASPGFDQSGAAHDRVFPYTGDAWTSVVRSHRKFLLARGFFPRMQARDDDPVAYLTQALAHPA